MFKKPETMEQVSVRRATIADRDKVRYRIYSSPTEFIAVIAESALMAVKTSGVAKPHKIVRDLPTEGIAIEAQKMQALDAAAERVVLHARQSQSKQLIAEIVSVAESPEISGFKPMGLVDLQKSGITRARIISPEMLSEIIESHQKVEPEVIPDPEPPVTAEPELAIAEQAPVEQLPEPVVPPSPVEPELSQEDKILKLADEEFSKLAMGSAPAAPQEEKLSPEEVEKLLNG